jgi:hypothetical protein
MMAIRLITRKSLIIWFLFSACVANVYGADVDQKNEQNDLCLSEWLQIVGKQADCYFTIEDERNTEDNSLLLMPMPPSNKMKKVQTVQDVVKSLQVLVKNVDITHESVVIHIANKNLSDMGHNWLDEKVNLDYNGTPSRLLSHILGLLSRVELQTTFPTHAVPRFDMVTRIWISGKAISTRKLLTDCMPLSRYSRILWISETEFSEGKQNVSVSFGGPVKLVTKSPASIVPFGHGEDAYRQNKKTGGEQNVAMEFLSNEMKKDTPHQARWAMFYLSQFEDAEITNTLLKHLAYCYSEIGPLEERYPAVLSLVMQGEPAVEPAIQQLLAEEDPFRTKLLMYVVLAVKGKDEGQKSIRAKAATLSEKQRDRIEKAMKDVLTTTKLKVSQQENEKKADAASPA